MGVARVDSDSGCKKWEKCGRGGRGWNGERDSRRRRDVRSVVGGNAHCKWEKSNSDNQLGLGWLGWRWASSL